MFLVGKSAWPSLWPDLFFFSLKMIKNRVEQQTVLLILKPLHSAVFSRSSRQTADMILALGIRIPRWDFFLLFWKGWGANTCHISFALLPSRCAHSSSGEELSPRAQKAGEFWETWSTPRVITERSGAMLSLFSHQNVQCAQTVFKIRHGLWRFMLWE